MAKIAFILLCHKDPNAIIDQATRLTAAGDFMAIHFDARAKREHFDKISKALKHNPNVVFARKRIKCGWGEWSLVQATLLAVEAAEKEFPRATHFYMLSGDCMAIKSAEYVHNFLDENDADFIESFDFLESDWIKTGIKEERLIYRHFFNERGRKKLFYGSMALQEKLGITRAIPADLQVMIGSQWWCLRRQTIEKILDFTRERPDVMRFFRTTWIPDETFFQTLVRHLIPEREIRTRTLTFLMFSDYGMPVTFYNDHYDLLLAQDFLFARKISPGATELKRRLGDLFATEGISFQISNEGQSLFQVSHRAGPGRAAVCTAVLGNGIDAGPRTRIDDHHLQEMARRQAFAGPDQAGHQRASDGICLRRGSHRLAQSWRHSGDACQTHAAPASVDADAVRLL